MILAQGAGTAASIAIDDEMSVQTIDYKKLRTRLRADKQILEKSQRLPDPRKKN